MDDRVSVRRQAADERGLARVIAELRQWHVFRIAVGYSVATWLVVQVIATVGPAFDLPEWVLRAVVLTAAVGFLATMGLLMVRPKGGGALPIYLSGRARLIVTTAVLLFAAASATYLFRSVGAREEIALAVVPFSDLSPARDKAYFAEGVAEEILSTLAGEKGFKVLGRTSAREIERHSDPRAIRASLGVTHLLEGSTRSAGNDLRINVRLIDTSDRSQLWDEEYRGAVSDVFKVQDQIATAVVRRLRGTLLGGAVRGPEPTAIDAYAGYLAARALIRETKKEPMARAFTMAQQIVKAHPDYAPGHALYAELAHLLTDGQFSYGHIPPDKSRPIILRHAREAIRLAPERAEGYAAIALALPWHERVAPLFKALEIDPSRADVRGRLSIALNILGRQNEAFEQIRLAAETDPLSPGALNRYAQMLAASGQPDEAMRAVEQFQRRGGSEAQVWRFRGNTYRYLGDETRHVAARTRALQIDPGLPYQHEWLAQAYHLLELRAEAMQYRPHVSVYFQLFVGDDRGALKDRVAKDKSSAWDTNGIDAAIFSLARTRDWLAIKRLYDIRPATHSNLCLTAPRFTPFIIMALQAHGTAAEARRLLDCTQRQVTSQLAMRYRTPDDAPGELEVLQASLLAIRRQGRTLDWLEKAIQRRWLGQYYSADLADWPQFDAFRSDPRYAAIQKRINATIARERAEVLALK